MYLRNSKLTAQWYCKVQTYKKKKPYDSAPNCCYRSYGSSINYIINGVLRGQVAGTTINCGGDLCTAGAKLSANTHCSKKRRFIHINGLCRVNSNSDTKCLLRCGTLCRAPFNLMLCIYAAKRYSYANRGESYIKN